MDMIVLFLYNLLFWRSHAIYNAFEILIRYSTHLNIVNYSSIIVTKLNKLDRNNKNNEKIP